MNAIISLFIACCVAGWLPSSANAEENYIINLRPQEQKTHPVQPAPDTTVIMPGTTTIVPGGTITVPEGTTTLPDVTATPTTPNTTIVPEGNLIVPEGTPALPDVNAAPTTPNTTIVPEGNLIVPEVTPTPPDVNATPTAPDTTIVPEGNLPVPGNTTIVPAKPSITTPQPSPVQLWQLMPLTNISKEPQNEPEKKPEPGKEPQAVKPEKKNEPEKKPAVKPEKTKPEPKPEPKKPEPPKPVKEPTRAPRPGEPLRIPEEALKTGNLDFLEGCWQGTRPEYYSKRIIKECFCFGKGGGSGKRRVNDPQNSRTCFGSSKAKMNGSVLNVSSEGAYCSDGERWGAAQMTCRGSGQSTPCSWVFTDAEGGEQSYEIPFVRVESCGGRR